MKTQVIYLEPHDDVASAKDKIAWGGEGRALLVWPSHSRLLDSKLALAQINQHAKSLGVEIALVVRDAEIRRYAEQFGMPVFRSVRRAQRTTWERPSALSYESGNTTERKERLQTARQNATPPPANPRLNTPTARLVFFSLGVLAFLAVGAVLLPSAEVHISPKTQTQELTLPISARPEYSGFNLSGALPARVIRVTVEGRDAVEVTGSIAVPERPAEGEALFTNLTDQAVDVPEGLTIRGPEDAPYFLTTAAGEVPGGGELLLPVKAADPGTGGNLPAGSLTIIDGPLGLNLSVTNPEPTQGGTDQQSPAPSQGDYDQLRAQLLAALSENAKVDAQAQLNPRDFIISSEPELLNTLEESFTPAEAAPANELSLTLRVEFEVQYVAWVDLAGMAAAILDASLPEGFTPLPDSLEVTQLTEPDSEGSWEIHIQRELAAQFSPVEALALVTGKRVEAAQEALEEAFALDAPVEIRLIPSWWPRLPVLPFRIQVVSG